LADQSFGAVGGRAACDHYLNSGRQATSAPNIVVSLDGMRTLGHTEGQGFDAPDNDGCAFTRDCGPGG
jgi:hypothetical protein